MVLLENFKIYRSRYFTVTYEHIFLLQYKLRKKAYLLSFKVLRFCFTYTHFSLSLGMTVSPWTKIQVLPVLISTEYV